MSIIDINARCVGGSLATTAEECTTGPDIGILTCTLNGVSATTCTVGTAAGSCVLTGTEVGVACVTGTTP
jgi:hypothetical protein